MIDDLDMLQKLLDTYKVTSPLPNAVREHILNNKRKQLIITLKKLGRYNSFFGIILFVFFLFRKLGIGLSIIQSVVVLTVYSLLIVGTITVSTYMYIKQLPESGEQIKKPVITESSSSVSSEKKITHSKIKNSQSAISHKFKNTIQLSKFESTSEKLSQIITSEIKKELIRFRGKGNIIFSDSDIDKSSVMIFGSIERIKNNYNITTRLVERKTGKLLYMASEEFESLDETNKICKKIAKVISGKVK